MNFPNQWTPELMNQWSTNQEMIYQNMPHDKVNWSALAKEWIDMSQNTVTVSAPPPHLPFNDLYFLQPQMPQLNLMHRPPMHLNNFNMPNHLMNQNSQFPYPFVHNQPHLNLNHLHMNAHFNQSAPPPPPLLSDPSIRDLRGPPPSLINPNFMVRKEPPLLPPFEPMINFNNNQFGRNDFEPNKFKEQNDFKKDLCSKPFDKPDVNPNIKNDFKDKVYDKKEINNKDQPIKSFNKPQQPTNNLKFNQPANNLKMNHSIPNQLDQELSTADDASNNNAVDVNKKKSLPEWIRQGLERLEKDKQKKIEKEEDLKKKAKEDQLRKELDNDEKDEEDDKTIKNDVEKKKIFSSSNLRNQKTFADMFLVKKGKDYYYESKEDFERELMLRTKNVLTNILIEVTDSIIRQVASKCIQEAKIQKIAALSQLAKPQPIKSSGLVGIVSQYYSDSEEEESSKKNSKKDIESKSKDDSYKKSAHKRNDRSKERSRRSRSYERRKRSLSRDYRRKRSRSREKSSSNNHRRNSDKNDSYKNGNDKRKRSRSRSRKKSRSRSRTRSSRDHSSRHRTRSRSRSRKARRSNSRKRSEKRSDYKSR